MPLITLSEIKKSFAERLLFENVSFEISENDRVGLVGVNGCGKTTLFRIITGEEAPDSGNIYRNSDLNIGVMSQRVDDYEGTLYEYVLQEFSFLTRIEQELDLVNLEIENETDLTKQENLAKKQGRLNDSYEDLGGLTYKSKTRSVLLGLGFTEDELLKNLQQMSGGQKNKAQLARVLLSKANLLLLDEPTNHLDISSVTWLEEYLCSLKCAIIVISHDRYFLDKVTNKTIELKNCHIKISKGNYTRHIELCGTQKEIEIRQFRKTQKEIRRIQGIVEQQKRWGQERNFVTIASKQKQIDRLKATLVEPEKDTAAISFNFVAADCIANDVLIAENLSKSYNGKKVFSNANLLIKNGERVFILGANGCGKTTLLRILSRREYPDSGRSYLGPKVLLGYYDQNVSNGMGHGTLLEEIHDAYPRMDLGEIRSAMARFLFCGESVFNSADKASGGERARVQLLKLMLSGANLLLLDEPTNHLDIASREALESALEEYSGTLVIVTHDRYLVNRLADRVLYMTQDGLVEYVGGYNEYLSAMENRSSKQIEEKNISENAISYKNQKELRSNINKTKGEIERTEKKIEEKEKEVIRLELEMNSPDYKKVLELSEKTDMLKSEIELLYDAWEKLTNRLTELER